MSIEENFKEYILEHKIESKESALKTSMAIQKSDLNLGHGYYTRTLQIPKFFRTEDMKNFGQIVNTTYGIFEKVMQAYRSDAAVRALFPFDKELEELILLEKKLDCEIPICRIDIFYNEETKDFAFCEFNTDGTSAMNENRRLNEFLPLNTVYEHFQPKAQIMELVESWADCFLQLCAQALDEEPVIAITDFLERAYLPELYVFEEEFAKKGVKAKVVDIRNLVYEDGKLKDKKSNLAFNAIYRRAVTRDVMEFKDEVQPFLQAVKDGNVLLIGPFATQIVHHKAISQVLFEPLMQSYLNEEEIAFIQKHVPQTLDLTEKVLEKIAQDKNAWIIKPKDSFASKGVFAGVDLNESEWRKVISECCNKDYIVQSYITPYQSENIDLINYDEFKNYSNLTGLYTYAGKFAGVYSRMSDGGIISSQYNEKTVPTLFLEEK
jgi:hypothetical protein